MRFVAACRVSSHSACARRTRTRTLAAAACAASIRGTPVKFLIALLLWCVLFVLCWPLALLALVLWPLAWLIALPFRLVGITFAALFAFLHALFMLPARLLGAKPARAAM